jgi:hypothetical protein
VSRSRRPKRERSSLPLPLDRLVETVARRENPLGEQLLVLGRGKVPAAGAGEGAVALDGDGGVVLIAAVPRPDERTAQDLADHLDRIGQLSATRLAEQAGDETADQLLAQHARFFDLDGAATLGGKPRAIVLVSEPPSGPVWQALDAELGAALSAVGSLDEDRWVGLRPPREAALRRPPSGRARSFGAAAVVLGAALVALGVVWLIPDRGGGRGPVNPISADVATVVGRVPGDATHTQWIGQKRLIRTATGSLLAFYASADRLHIVEDDGDGGRTWRSAVAVPEIVTRSFSVAPAGGGRVQVAFTEGRTLSYAVLARRGDGWSAGPILRLDARAPTDSVDLAWDPDARVAHVVWASSDRRSQRPRWAAVRPGGERPRIVATSALGPPARGRDVLANVATGPGSLVVATFRPADDEAGWVARAARLSNGRFRWAAPAVLSTSPAFGAGALAVDRDGVAHLVLRDDAGQDLRYFRRSPAGRWSEGEVAVPGDSLLDVELPDIGVSGDGRVFVFFQSDRFGPNTEVRMAVRDPEGGWSDSYGLVTAAPDGFQLPVAPEEIRGPPTVLWTTEGEVPLLQLARVRLP